MARRRRAASESLAVEQQHKNTPTEAGHRRSKRLRDPNVDTRFALLVHALSNYGVRPLFVRPATAKDAPLVIRRKLTLGTIRLLAGRIMSGRNLPVTVQGEMNLLGLARSVGAKKPKDTRKRKSSQKTKPLSDLLEEMGFAVPPTLRLYGEDILPIEVPSWSTAGDAMKAAGLFTIGCRLGHRSVTIKLSKAIQAQAIAYRKGPAQFLQQRVAKKLRDAGLKGTEFAFVIDTNVESDLHLHGCMGFPSLDLGKLDDRRRMREALGKVCGPDATVRNGIKIKKFNSFPEGFGGYAAKYSLVTKAELTKAGAAPKILLKTQGLTAQATEWWNAERQTNLTDLIQAIAASEGVDLADRNPEAEKKAAAKAGRLSRAKRKRLWTAHEATLALTEARMDAFGRPKRRRSLSSRKKSPSTA